MLWTFSIRNVDSDKVYAHLTYDWDKDIYSMKIDSAIPDGAPAIIQVLANQGECTMNDKLCRCFIRDRIIPANRQNIGMILRSIGEKYYHECFMLKHYSTSVLDSAFIELESIKE